MVETGAHFTGIGFFDESHFKSVSLADGGHGAHSRDLCRTGANRQLSIRRSWRPTTRSTRRKFCQLLQIGRCGLITLGELIRLWRAGASGGAARTKLTSTG